ncbi:TPA: 4-(cytidine 5'-diphospho)-2-C-methyl-D-erythritol kinase, partial [Enterococcus faecium]|nr:4-(cytidine 5'-diphospho)-2-C-methyl-D-erythritol kinase [Enterococcus faecium]
LGQSLDDLAALGIQIGTDIPFCIYNQTAVCTGRGEQVTFLKRPPSAWVVLAKPNIGISSPDVFKALDLTEEHIVHNEKCKQALENND